MADLVSAYVPRPQFYAFHGRRQRFAAMVAHRQAGKTVACVNDLIAKATYSKRIRPRYAYVAPLRNQAKGLAWDYLKAYTEGLVSRKSESELSLEFKHNDARITLYGADNPDAMRGLYFDGIILDEYGDMNPITYTKILLPTLQSRKGWIVFIGTPKGKNHFFHIWRRALTQVDQWFTYMLRASTSGIYTPEELSITKGEMTEDEYQQEYECSFEAAVMGTYYSRLITSLEEARHVTEFCDYDPEFPVTAVADLGFTDSTAWWHYQTRPQGLALIDYDEESGQALPYYFDLLKDKPWGENYEKIWLPHDARAKTFQTGRSTLEQFLETGWNIDIVPRLSIQHGIDAARLLLPNSWFNPRCSTGIEALRAYQRKYNEKTKSYGNAPLHNWASHGSDAFRYLSLVAQERILPKSEPPAAKPVEPEVICLEELFKEREDRQRRRRVS